MNIIDHDPTALDWFIIADRQGKRAGYIRRNLTDAPSHDVLWLADKPAIVRNLPSVPPTLVVKSILVADPDTGSASRRHGPLSVKEP